MNRPAKLSFSAAALIGTAALAAYIVDKLDPSRLRIARLKYRAWKASRDLPYTVTLRRRTSNLSGQAGAYAPYWTWVSIIGSHTSELGPLQTLDFAEGFELARQQWKERARKKREPARPSNQNEPLVSGAKLAHRMSFTPIDGERMRIDCICGQFQSRPTEPCHQFENGCASCDDVMREWEEHAAMLRPQPLPAEPIRPGEPLIAADLKESDVNS
jgi:hypothetical protein